MGRSDGPDGFRGPTGGNRRRMPAALISMSVAERERYVRWWIEESGLTLVQLRDVAGAVWSEDGESRVAVLTAGGRAHSAVCVPSNGERTAA